eukprot:13543323-Alexandrium_andersonii.AAC.1
MNQARHPPTTVSGVGADLLATNLALLTTFLFRGTSTCYQSAEVDPTQRSTHSDMDKHACWLSRCNS